MSNMLLPIHVKGHAHIVDDLGNVLLDQDNAIHPQNMARIFARALSREDNYFIRRIAFGNGGTSVDAAFTVTYNTPNDGQAPDTATWNSRIYNETYSEVVDFSDPLFKQDPGSADLNTGVRSGGGSVPASDPVSVQHVSGPGVRSTELGVTSQVLISCTLNGDEPTSQFLNDNTALGTESDFVFDEIGLYTGGAPAIPTSGYQYIDVHNRTSLDDSTLVPGQTYSFNIAVDGGSVQTISFTVPLAGGSGAAGQVLYGDLCQAVNTGDPAWTILPGAPSATLSITDDSSGTFPTIAGAQTFGFLKFTSPSTGSTSSISLAGGQTNTFVALLNAPNGAQLEGPQAGSDAGLQNDPTDSADERERLLAHLIFSPVLKSASRTLAITYTLTISVARSIS